MCAKRPIHQNVEVVDPMLQSNNGSRKGSVHSCVLMTATIVRGANYTDPSVLDDKSLPQSC